MNLCVRSAIAQRIQIWIQRCLRNVARLVRVLKSCVAALALNPRSCGRELNGGRRENASTRLGRNFGERGPCTISRKFILADISKALSLLFLYMNNAKTNTS